jgi:hypothetical protein
MLTKIEKLSLLLLALFMAILFLIITMLNISENKEHRTCKSFCELSNSEIRLYESGVCICQK